MTRPLRPGRLAVRRDSSGYWRLHSPIRLSGFAGDLHADGTYSYPFGNTRSSWEAVVREALIEARINHDRLVIDTLQIEPS